MSPDFNAILTSTIVFLLVLAGAAVLVYTIWRQGRHNNLPWQKSPAAHQHKRLRIIERTPLSPQHQLALVQCDEQEYLILTHPSHSTITPLHHEHKNTPPVPQIRQK